MYIVHGIYIFSGNSSIRDEDGWSINGMILMRQQEYS